MNEILTQDPSERLKELMKRKKKLLVTIRKNKKTQVKARIEKRKINEEIRTLKGKANQFRNMTPEEAQAEVRRRIDDVDPSEVYPKDLERQFDRLDKPTKKNYKVIDLGRLPEKPLNSGADSDDDQDSHVGSADAAHPDLTESNVEEEGVVDLSDQ